MATQTDFLTSDSEEVEDEKEEPATSNLFIMAPRSANSVARRANSGCPRNCFVIENFKCDSMINDEPERSNGLDLHRSTTTTSFTSRAIFSSDDYHEIMYNVGARNELFAPVKQFPRRPLKNVANLKPTGDSRRISPNLAKAKEPFRAATATVLKPSKPKPCKASNNDNFVVLFDFEHKLDYLPKVLETYSRDEIVKVGQVVRQNDDSPSE